MAKKLVLVESPSKAKTINKYLGKDYIVEATIGHIKNLPKSKLGIDVDNGFVPQFVTIRGKGDTVKKIKDLANKSSHIFIATDPDREGEAIAQDIADVIDEKHSEKISRVLFNEITKNGVKKGMDEPRPINTDLVASQRARRVMDRIIGYKISPFLWRSVVSEAANSLSAGRVQSVALRLICERDAEIDAFIEQEYWSVGSIFLTDKEEEIHSKLHSIDGVQIKTPAKDKKADEKNESDTSEIKHTKSMIIHNAEEAENIIARIKKVKDFEISNIARKHTKRNAPPPFITSTMQAEASKMLRMRAKQTMMYAQRLYEGVTLGSEGLVGLITYMRTDSTRLSDDICKEASEFLKNTYGPQYAPETIPVYGKKKGSNVQDAHEAIRPTSLKYTPEYVKPFLDDHSFKLYSLIWKRFLASQMKPAEFETTVVEITGNEFLFKAYGQVLLFDGFTKLYVEQEESSKEEEREEAKNDKIPAGLNKHDQLKLKVVTPHQHFTKPPGRYTESSLIKELESLGIGRPSTYSMIVSTIVDRKYVESRERKIYATELGKKINGILIENFPGIIDTGFTAKMELELDQIAQGEYTYSGVLNDFYNPFSSALSVVEDKIEKIICELCGGEMVIRYGRFGKFLSCNNYPDCKNIKSLRELAAANQEPEYTGDTCEKCGSRTLFRNGRFGKFIGCEKYPECDFIKNITLNISCPKCKDGEVLERRSKRGKIFYGCSRYPDCDFVAWNKPSMTKCNSCGSPYMEEKYSKKKGKYLQCPSCKEEIILEPVEEES